MVAEPEVVIADIAGAVGQLGHVGAVGGELKRKIVVWDVGRGVFTLAADDLFDRVEHSADVHTAVAAYCDAPHLPAIDRIAGDDAPVAFVLRIVAHAAQPPHDDGEKRTAARKIRCTGHGAHLITELDARAGIDRLLGRGVCAGRPLVVIVVEQEYVGALRLQFQMDILLRAITRPVRPFAEDEIANALVIQLVEADDGAGVAVRQHKAALRVGHTGGEQTMFTLALVDDVRRGRRAVAGVHLCA